MAETKQIEHEDLTAKDIDAIILAEKRTKNSYLSLSIDLRMHRPCRDYDLAPEDGSIMRHLWRRGKLNQRHLKAWQMFWRDYCRSYGDSASLITSYQERVSTSSAGVARETSEDEGERSITGKRVANIRMAEWSPEFAIIDEKWKNFRKEERGILDQLIRDYITVTSGTKIHSHDLAYIGKHLSGYKDNRQAIAAGVARIQAIMTHLADLYMVK